MYRYRYFDQNMIWMYVQRPECYLATSFVVRQKLEVSVGSTPSLQATLVH